MMQKKFVVITFLLLFFIGISVVSAEENVSDEVLADGDMIPPSDGDVDLDVWDEDSVTQSSSSFKDLQDHIDKVKEGGSLKLPKNLTYNSKKDSKNGITIKKSVTIDGKGFALDGDQDSRIFLIGNKNAKITVVLKNLVIVNGYAEDGGAIKLVKSSDVSLQLINCTFKHNRAYDGHGGAIYSDLVKSRLTIENSKFEENTAAMCGGAIFTQGHYTTVKNSIFKNNNANDGSGGALDIYDEKSALLSNSIFESNIATTCGGAVSYMSSDPMTISDCTFTKNYADSGGAVFWSCYDGCKISNSIFKSNTAKYTGGAISFDCPAILSNNVFEDNNLPELEVHYKNNCYLRYNSGNDLKIKILHSLTKAPVSNVQVKLYVKLSNGGKKYTTKVFTAVTDNKGVATFKVSKLSKYYYYGHFKFANSFKVIDNPKEYGYFNDQNALNTDDYKVFQISKASTKIKAPKITAKYKKSKYFKVKITSSKKPLKQIKLKLKISTGKKVKTYTVKTNKKGEAKFNTKNLKKGSHKVVIQSGNTLYNYVIKGKSKIVIK